MIAAFLTAVAMCASAVDALASTGGAAASSEPAVTEGRSVATWFGPGFYGNETACGQILTHEVIGVAHRTLPCGSLVKLSYRERTIVVPGDRPRPLSARRHLGPHGGRSASAGRNRQRACAARSLVGQVANTPLLGSPPGSAASAATGGNAAG